MAVTEDRLGRLAATEPDAASGSRQDGSRRTPRELSRGLTFNRRFTQPGAHPYDQVEWEQRTAAITGEGGEKVFEQVGVEIPAFWSQQATKVVVSKYFRG